MANILEDLIDYVKPKAHDAINYITDSWDSMIESQNTWKELGLNPEESKEFINSILDPTYLGLGAIGAIKNLKLFRGIPKWFRKGMTKKGKYVGGGSNPGTEEFWRKPAGYFGEGTVYTSTNPKFAKAYMDRKIIEAESQIKILESYGFGQKKIKELKNIIKEYKGKGKLLEFHVPEKVLKDIAVKSRRIHLKKDKNVEGTSYAFPGGIPKTYLKKVYSDSPELVDMLISKMKIPAKAKQSKLDILLDKLKDNPNVGGNIGRVMSENIKKYKP